MLVYTKVEGIRSSNRIPEVRNIDINGCNYPYGTSNSTEKGVGKHHITIRLGGNKKDVEVFLFLGVQTISYWRCQNYLSVWFMINMWEWRKYPWMVVVAGNYWRHQSKSLTELVIVGHWVNLLKISWPDCWVSVAMTTLNAKQCREVVNENWSELNT